MGAGIPQRVLFSLGRADLFDRWRIVCANLDREMAGEGLARQISNQEGRAPARERSSLGIRKSWPPHVVTAVAACAG